MKRVLTLVLLACAFALPANAKDLRKTVVQEACFLFCAPVTHAGKERRMSGIVAPLAAKAREIKAACGSKIVSGVRHTYIAGTRRISLHASGQAVDMVGNPKCIYAHLRGWPGGYSTDYRRARHVHISWTGGGREWGARFAHGHVKRHRHARRLYHHRQARRSHHVAQRHMQAF